jgi:hypothetical protein
MNLITQLFVWIETRLDQGAWFRRLYVVAATAMTWKVIEWSMLYATLNSSKDGLQVAAIIGAVSGVVAAVQGFAFKSYLDSRSGGSIETTTQQISSRSVVP